MPGLFGTDWVIDPYRVFLVVALGGLGLLSAAMLAVALFLLRRNRRLPRLVKPQHGGARDPRTGLRYRR